MHVWTALILTLFISARAQAASFHEIRESVYEKPLTQLPYYAPPLFRIQVRTDPAAMPIEDPTVEWPESKSPYLRVARVMIPRQDFQTAVRQEFCESLSMTPWNALPEHRPLGGINRMRKAVYQKVSELRHDLNRAPRVEPTSYSWQPPKVVYLKTIK